MFQLNVNYIAVTKIHLSVVNANLDLFYFIFSKRLPSYLTKVETCIHTKICRLKLVLSLMHVCLSRCCCFCYKKNKLKIRKVKYPSTEPLLLLRETGILFLTQ